MERRRFRVSPLTVTDLEAMNGRSRVRRIWHWCISELERRESRHWGVAGERCLATTTGKPAMYLGVVPFEFDAQF